MKVVICFFSLIGPKETIMDEKFALPVSGIHLRPGFVASKSRYLSGHLQVKLLLLRSMHVARG